MKRLMTICIAAGILLTASASGNIINPSFEDDPAPQDWITPTGWSLHDSDDFGEGTDTSFATDGINNYRFWSFVYEGCSAGSYESIYQTVNLTGITKILFDVRLSCHFYGNPCKFQDYKAEFLVDGTPYWTQTAEGTYLNQSIDISALSGLHTIELRQECVKNETYDPSCWTEWDNLRAIPEPATICLLGLGVLGLLRQKKNKQNQQITKGIKLCKS
jgi:hypothetical protein